MNLQETVALIEALRAAGVTKFKSLEHDIVMDGKASIPLPVNISPPQPPPVENKEATEKIKDLIGTLKMSDEDLVNKMFPDGAL